MDKYEQYREPLSKGFMMVEDINIYVNSGYSISGSAMMLAVALKEELDTSGMLKQKVKMEVNRLINQLDEIVGIANSSIEEKGKDMCYGSDINLFYQLFNRKGMTLKTKAILIYELCRLVEELTDAIKRNMDCALMRSPIAEALSVRNRRCISFSGSLCDILGGRECHQWKTLKDDIRNIFYTVLDR